MARSGFAALFLILLPVPSWAQSSAALDVPRATLPDRSDSSRRDFTIGEIERAETDDRISLSTEIGRNLSAGLGMYGPKRDTGYQRPVTGRELDLRKQRRAGVGFSLKF